MSNGLGYKSEVSNMYPPKLLFSLDIFFDKSFISLAFILPSDQIENLSVSCQMSILKDFFTCSSSHLHFKPCFRDKAPARTKRYHLPSEPHDYAVTFHLLGAIYLVCKYNGMLPSHRILQPASYRPVWILKATVRRTIEA